MLRINQNQTFLRKMMSIDLKYFLKVAFYKATWLDCDHIDNMLRYYEPISPLEYE